MDDTVIVPLSYSNLVALVDAEDAERVLPHRWHVKWFSGNPYAARTQWSSRKVGKRKSRTVLLHRFVMGEPEGLDVDHVNGDTLDCRKEFLRVATDAENARNKRQYSSSHSPYKGVTFLPEEGRWRACIRCDGVKSHLGTFRTAEEAAHVYDLWAIRLHGEFARTNFPRETYAGMEAPDPRLNRHALNASGFAGVNHRASTRKWIAFYGYRGEHVHVGVFDTAEEAARARDAAIRAVPDCRAHLNFPDTPS